MYTITIYAWELAGQGLTVRDWAQLSPVEKRYTAMAVLAARDMSLADIRNHAALATGHPMIEYRLES